MVKRLNIKGPKSLLIEGLGPKVNVVLFFVIIIILLLLFYTNLFILLFMFKNKTKNVLKNYNETKKLHVFFPLFFPSFCDMAWEANSKVIMGQH